MFKWQFSKFSSLARSKTTHGHGACVIPASWARSKESRIIFWGTTLHRSELNIVMSCVCMHLYIYIYIYYACFFAMKCIYIYIHLVTHTYTCATYTVYIYNLSIQTYKCNDPLQSTYTCIQLYIYINIIYAQQTSVLCSYPRCIGLPYRSSSPRQAHGTRFGTCNRRCLDRFLMDCQPSLDVIYTDTLW